jgi:putative NIF3 family GTP cyclohydrolase 1 type 2
LDSIWGGVNDWLAQGVLGGHATASDEGQIRVLAEQTLGPNGQTEGGEGRLVTLKEPIDMKELEKRVSNHLRVPQSQLSLLVRLAYMTLLVGGNIVR